MFAYFKGTLTHSSSTSVIIETAGIGYKIFVSVSALNKLPQLGSQVFLHTSFVVRELAQTLYGFVTAEERDFFECLIGVTGIGPKIAMAILGHLSMIELQHALSNGDTPTLCRVPGIGKKGAERLIIEMRDKVAIHAFSPSEFAIDLTIDLRNQTVNDAMSALINLGYTQVVAQKAIKKTLKDHSEDLDVSALISYSLKNV